jgi:photosystem II stability/assembly factor-like uncharacterized protein
MIAIVSTSAGMFAVDLETEEVEQFDDVLAPAEQLELNLPRLVAAAAAGATVVAVVDTKPPLVVSHDAGTTWRQSGRGLPPGRAVAIALDDPDTAVFAARNRLYVTHDGGTFWTAVAVELPEIEAVQLRS